MWGLCWCQPACQAYVYQHGVSWAYAPSTAGDVFMTSYTPDIIWLLQQRGIQLPSKQQQGEDCTF
jgi:hypothetical protein